MRNLFRSLGIMITVLAVAGVFAGCAKKLPGAVAAEDKTIIVARVNGADISRYAVTAVMNRMIAINAGNSVSEPREETKKKALDQALFEELAVQEAGRRGLRVKETEIDTAITALVGHEQADRDALLAKLNMTEPEMRAEAGRRLLTQRIYVQEVVEKVAVTDDEVRREYELRKDQFLVPEKVAVVDVALSSKLDEQASMKKAAEIIDRIKADAERNPWNLPHDGAYVVRDLDLAKGKDPALYDAARRLKEGELSGPVTSGGAVHILKLSEYAPQRQRSYEEVKDPLAGRLKAVALAKRFAEWERELKQGAKIEVLDPPVRRERKNP